MKILQISSAGGFGGGERHLLALTRGLRERGHEVYVALDPEAPLGRRLAQHEPPPAPDASATGQAFVPLMRRGKLNLGAVRPLARFVAAHGVEIVHAHVGRDYAIAASALRLSKTRARLVLTRHVLFGMNPLNKITLSNVSRVIAVSEAVARSLRAQRIFDEETIRVVTNGLDASEWRRADAREPRLVDGAAVRTPLRVGIVGELSEVKAQADFVRAAAVVAERHDGPVEFVIVGEDYSGGEYRAALSKLINEAGLARHVQMLGWREDVAEILPTFDVLVSASRSEAFGMALVEAMACAVPVVATATEGAREVVADGETGIVVPVGDTEALADATLKLLADPERRARMGARASSIARSRFSVRRMVEATERVYKEALGQSRGR